MLKFVPDAVVSFVYASDCGFVYAGGYIIVYKPTIAARFHKIIIQ